MATSPHRVRVLAAEISSLTSELEKYHDDNGLPPLSFGEDQWNEHRYPDEIEDTRARLIDATEELEDLVNGPRKMLRLKLRPTTNFLDIINTFDIPNKVPVNDKISYHELSLATGVKESMLKRTIRYATSHRVFHEVEPGFVSHSAASRLLVEESAMTDWMGANLRFLQPALMQHAAAIEKWPNAEGPSQTAFNLSDSTGSESFWKFLAADPKKAKMFASSMTIMAKHGAMSFNHVTDNFPWASLGEGTVVDIGGSSGDLGFAIAEKFPSLNVIVEDLPKTIATAKEKPGVNVKFLSHDYYDIQPVQGADVYMFRWCFHDIRDQDGVKVLRALIPALRKSSRILLVDAAMPTPGSVLNCEERWLRSTDLLMAAMFNAREREAEEWKQLFASADSRFMWKGITQPKGSRLALIESVWQPNDER